MKSKRNSKFVVLFGWMRQQNFVPNFVSFSVLNFMFHIVKFNKMYAGGRKIYLYDITFLYVSLKNKYTLYVTLHIYTLIYMYRKS